MGQHGALGLAGGAGGVDEGGDVIGRGCRRALGHGAPAGLGGCRAKAFESLEGHDVDGAVGAEAVADVDVAVDDDDVAQTLAVGDDREHDVELLPVADIDYRRARVVDDVLDLVGAGGGVNRHGDSAVGVCGEVGDEEFGAVCAEDGRHARFGQAEGLEGIGYIGRTLAQGVPRQRLPPAVAAFVYRCTVAVARALPLDKCCQNVVHKPVKVIVGQRVRERKRE